VLLALDVTNQTDAMLSKNNKNNDIMSNPSSLLDSGGELGSDTMFADDDRMSGDSWHDPITPTISMDDNGTTVGEEGGELEDSTPGGRFAHTNESVHYDHHRPGFCLLSNGYSCHGCVEQVSLNENLSKSVPVSGSSIIVVLSMYLKTSVMI
jgi:hypothetical protein